MKKFLSLSLAVILCATSLFAETTTANLKERLMNRHTGYAISTPDMRKNSPEWGIANYSKQLRQQAADPAWNTTPFNAFHATGYGVLEGPDGSDWFYTENIKWRGTYSDHIGQATFTFYDATYTKIGTVSMNIDYENKWINQLSPYGIVSTDFFDNDESTYEVFIYEHEVYKPGVTGNRVHVYSIGKSEPLDTFDGGQAALFQVQKNEWDTYRRLLVVNDTVHVENNDSIFGSRIALYKPVGMENKVTFENEIFVPEDNLICIVGSYINTYAIDGEPYLTVAHYEKPFFTGEWNTEVGEQLMTPDNYLVVTLYDGYLNPLKQIKVKCDEPEKAAAMYGSGFLTYEDLSKGMFTSNDEFAFIITKDVYNFTNDNDFYTFEVYNEKGEMIKTIDKDIDAEGVMELSDIRGQEKQFAFGHTVSTTDSTSTTFIRLVNFPSCTVANEITPSTDMPITFEMNRYPTADSYQYVFSYSTAEMDGDANVYAILGCYNADLTLNKTIKFNLGPNGLMARFNLSASALNPFLFNTSDDREFVFLSNIARDNSELKDTWLNVADHEGNILEQWVGNTVEGDIRQVGFLNVNTPNACMYIAYDKNFNYTVKFIRLPFVGIQGAGTAEDPYLVATVGDLQQVVKNPAAHYKQVADIDMNIYGRTWNAIPTFTGTYEGNNHFIRNLNLENTKASTLALFDQVQNATIRNIRFNSPVINVHDQNAYAAVVAGIAVGSTFENIHVNNATISSPTATASVGGIVASATAGTRITGCSFQNSVINVPAASLVGGIAGEGVAAGTSILGAPSILHTPAAAAPSTTITACYVDADITAHDAVGGILGQQGSNTLVQNNFVKATITANNTLGGIVGQNFKRSTIANNVAKVTLKATDTATSTRNLGGVVGYLQEDWTAVATKIVKGNIVALDAVVLPENKVDGTVHSVVGYSIENAEKDAPEDPDFVEAGLDNNYLLQNLTIADTTLVGTHDNVSGALKTPVDADFLKTIGFAYGENNAAPWKDASPLPYLYYTDQLDFIIAATGIELSQTSISLFVGETTSLWASVLPYDVTNRAYTWELADPTIVSYENEQVTALAQGSTTITFTSEDGNFTAVCKIRVKEQTGLSDILSDKATNVRKVFENGTIYILRTQPNGITERYTIDGRKVK